MVSQVWTIQWNNLAQKVFDKLDNKIQNNITKYLNNNVNIDPKQCGKALTGKYASHWCYKVGYYRIICKHLPNKATVLVIEVGNRKNVYA